MSTAQNKEIMQRLVEEYFNTGDPAITDEWLSPNFVNHNLSWGIPEDREGFEQYVQALHSAFPDLHFVVDQLIAEGQTVAAYLTATGTHQGQFWGVEPTDKNVSVSTIWIARFSEGKVSEWWSTWDWWSLMQQLGVSTQSLQEAVPQR
jgi:predicted ester cyclase